MPLHCQLIRTDDGFTLEDLPSRNGTFVNGVRIKEPTKVLRVWHRRCSWIVPPEELPSWRLQGPCPIGVDSRRVPCGAAFLEISGTSQSNGERSEHQYHIRELSYGSFKRQLRLPDNLDGEPVAELKDGILKLTFKLHLPEEQQPKSRKIPIQKG